MREPGTPYRPHHRPDSPYYWLSEKMTSIVVSTSTVTPFNSVGLYLHCCTASIAARTSKGCPDMTSKDSTEPVLEMRACKRTVPEMRVCRASGGYTGCTLFTSNAAWTLPPWRMRWAVGFGGGGAPPMPPMTPPITPPIEPPATPPGTPPAMPALTSGASSLIILMSLGMTFGCTSLPASIKWTCGLTCTTCVCTGGGGGGGGGGGATSSVDIIAFGSASV